MNFRLTDHAESEMIRRKIPRQALYDTLERPQQIAPTYGGRVVYQSKIEFGEDKTYLLRAIIEAHTSPPTVVTVYLTSKIQKYWRTS